MIDEEAIFAALFNRAAEVRWTRPGDDPDARAFKYTSRRVRLFSDVPSSQQPSCMQAEADTLENQVTNQPYKTVLEARWLIYHKYGVNTDSGDFGASENNRILGGVRNALAPKTTDPGFADRRNTLDGLVHHCFIQGRIFKDPGDLDGQAMIVVPIKLLVP